jgi:L-asparagine oxygenase
MNHIDTRKAAMMGMTNTIPAPRTIGHIDLPATATDRLRQDLLALPDPTADPCRATTRLLQVFAAALDTKQLQQILDAGRHPDTPGVTLVTGLPTDPVLPATPIDGGPASDKDSFVSEGVVLGLSTLIGEPYGVHSEKCGQLVHDVIPVENGARTQTNMGSTVFLNFHNDIIHDAAGHYTLANPDFLVLLCVRPDPEGKALTYYADARDILAALPAQHADQLRQAQFQLNAPGNYCRTVGQDQVLSNVTAIITGPHDYPEVGTSANGVIALTRAGELAFAAFQVACREVAHEVALRPGQALIINNRKGLHARSSFAARHDGTDRWLQRSYVRRCFWTSRYRAGAERWLL